MKKIKVAFRKFPDDGEVIAVFTDIWHNKALGLLESYCHNGQHGGCDKGVLGWSEAAREEYLPLLGELKAIGYKNIEVI